MNQAKCNQKKKGSLSLSINAIVVLILAITMLALGLAFIRNLFGGAVSKLTDVYGELREQDRQALLASEQEITFALSEIQVPGREVQTYVALRNIRADKLGFRVRQNLYCFDAMGILKDRMVGTVLASKYFDASTTPYTVRTSLLEQDARSAAGIESPSSPWVSFESFDERDLDAGKSDVLPLKIKVAANAPATMYSCAFAPAIIRRGDSSGQFRKVSLGQSNPLYESYNPKMFNVVITK